MTEHTPRLTTRQLIENARGVAYAAFAPIDALTARLGGDRGAANALQETACLDLQRLQRELKQLRERKP